MRKIFTLFTMLLLATTVWGQTVVTFIPGETYGNNETAQGADSMQKDGITIATTSGGLKAAQYRFAKGSVTTVSSVIGNITKIEFTCSASGDAKYGPGCFAAQTGYSYEGNMGIWQGSSTSVDFTAETNQVRATKIVVTVDGGGLSNPTINPAAGTYYAPIQVTITCGTSGAKIYYTTNGSNPTTSSTQYTAPFTVSSNTTVKAISAKDGDVSDVVSAEYVFSTATGVANIAAFQGTADDVVVKFNNAVNVLAQHNSYLYVKDNTGYALFYGKTNQTYKNGDVIPAGFVGTKTTYAGEPELQVINGFEKASSNNPIAPETITANQVGHSMFAHYVTMSEVTIVKVDDRNYTLTDAHGNTCAIYFGSMGVSAPASLDGVFDVVGVVGSYGSENTVYQLLPTSIKKHTNPGEGVGLGNLGNLSDNEVVTIDYDAIVLGQTGSYLYLKDDTGFGLAYGDCGQNYTYGDIIPAGYGGTKTTWDGEPELKSLTGFGSTSGNIGGIEALNKSARPTNPSEVGHDIWGQYVKLSKVVINANEKTLTDANGNSCPYYDRFGIALPADLSKAYDVYGIVASYGKAPNTVYQILPTFIDAGPIVPVDVANIPELYDLSQGQVGHFTTPLTTIYQNGLNLYVKDVDGNYSLAYGNVAYNDFVNGDFINDANASWSEYQGAKQMKPVAETFVKSGHGTAVKPEMMPIEEVSQDNIHWYFAFENVQLTEEEAANTYNMIDETGEMLVFNKFNQDVTVPELSASDTYDVEGFLTVYKGQLELYPIKVVKHGDFVKGDVNGDGEVTLADVNLLIDIILGGQDNTNGRSDVNGDGEANIADVNEVIDIILNN